MGVQTSPHTPPCSPPPCENATESVPPWCKRLPHGSTRSTSSPSPVPLAQRHIPAATRVVAGHTICSQVPPTPSAFPQCFLAPWNVSACLTQQCHRPPAPPCSLLSQRPLKHPDLGPTRNSRCHMKILAVAAILQDEKRQQSPIILKPHTGLASLATGTWTDLPSYLLA